MPLPAAPATWARKTLAQLFKAPLICDHPRTAGMVMSIADACAAADRDDDDERALPDAAYRALSARAATLAPYAAVMQRHLNQAHSPPPW